MIESRRNITKVNLSQDEDLKTPPSTTNLDFFAPREPSPVISPWNGSNNNNHHHRGATAIIYSPETQQTTPIRKQPPIHPYAQRYMRDTVSITTGHGGVTLSPATKNNELEDSFQKILDTADNSITQAETILNNLKKKSGNNDEEEKNSVPLDSDIENNIRRLERTQAKINAALQTFRNVQQRSRYVVQSDNFTTPSFPSTSNQLSRTAPGKLENKKHVSAAHSGN